MGKLIAFKRPKADPRSGRKPNQPCLILFFTGIWRERMKDAAQTPKRPDQGGAKRPGKGRGKSEADRGDTFPG